MTEKPILDEYALIIQRSSGAQLVLNSLLRLLLNFQYGLNIMVARSTDEARRRLGVYPGQIRCIFMLENAEPEEIAYLSNPDIPLFLVLPEQLAQLHTPLLNGKYPVYLCPQERAFTKGPAALTSQVKKAFITCGIEDLLGPEKLPFDQLRQRIAQRIGKLHTLPTLPAAVVRIMELIDDPTSTIDDLENCLLKDPSLLLKVQQVASSPDFAPSTARESDITLHESIVRLGLEKIGVIAQQIQLMNSLVKPKDSAFDMERFWSHSLSCALIADRIVSQNLVRIEPMPPFRTYWMGCLLHDIGKLVLGYFFPQRYAELCRHLDANPHLQFRRAEMEMGNIASHDYLGHLMLLKSGANIQLVEAVGFHHELNASSPAVCHLIHLSNQLSKDIGMGYTPGERGTYSTATLRHFAIDAQQVKTLRNDLRAGICESVARIIEQCRPNAAMAIPA